VPTVPVKILPDHRYEAPGGKILPGISSRLKAAGLMFELDGNHFVDPSKGQRVHEAVHYAMEDDLDLETVDPAELGYVNAALLAIKREGWEVLGAEYPVGNTDLGYATRIDLLANVAGKKTVINWKTGDKALRVYAIQSALEALLFSPEPVQRLGVHLKADGSYRLEYYTNRRDFDVAKACLTVASFVKG
jgi:hypothetical protein